MSINCVAHIRIPPPSHTYLAEIPLPNPQPYAGIVTHRNAKITITKRISAVLFPKTAAVRMV